MPLMVQRLLFLKDTVQDLGIREVFLTDFEWMEVGRLAKILDIPLKATVALQRESLTPGECLLEWNKSVFELRK